MQLDSHHPCQAHDENLVANSYGFTSFSQLFIVHIYSSLFSDLKDRAQDK